MTDSATDPTSNSSSDSTNSTDSDLIANFDKPVSEQKPTSIDQLSVEELQHNVLMLEEIIDDFKRHIEPPNKRFNHLDMLEDLMNVLRSEANDRRRASEANHIINAVEPVWASVEHVFDPETGRPTEVALNNRELIESLHDASEYECSCDQQLHDWAAVKAHLEEQEAHDGN